ncbi:uncharacterized protein LOC119666730 [Teleopsis dalmanni]|uniref:uncharacterized protein LOC119666730 n=1 Tax=Teleopsis dalmanni TaxID=139649 RepID=UPI0018CCBC95|nr:uncharacterized protein LOC119666730 [Teleopsis dalmanni]
MSSSKNGLVDIGSNKLSGNNTNKQQLSAAYTSHTNAIIPNNLHTVHCEQTSDYSFIENVKDIEENPILCYEDDYELQSGRTSFVTSGIFRKQTDGSNSNAKLKNLQHSNETQNVYLTPLEQRGRIINTKEFYNFYLFRNVNNRNSIDLPEVLPIKSSETILANVPQLVTELAGAEESNLIPHNLDTLSKLAYNILKFSKQDRIVIDRKRNEILRTELSTNQKTVYRFLLPKDFKLKLRKTCKNKQIINATNESVKPKSRVGRHKKKTSTVANALDKSQLTFKNVNHINKTQGVACDKTKTDKSQDTSIRTRSGRLIKITKPTISQEETSNFVHEFIEQLTDKDYKCSKNIKTPQTSEPQMSILESEQEKSTPATTTQSKRRVPPESICPTCNKIFLGRRLQKHFIQHPDHMKQMHLSSNEDNQIAANNDIMNEQIPPNEEMSLFRFFISKLQKSNLNEDQRAEIFLNELNDFVEQLQLRSSRIIRNTSGLHLVTSRTARVLGIPEGQYALDMTAIEAPPELDTSCGNYDMLQSHKAPLSNVRNIDYTALSMSLDNTITDEAAQKLNLSAGGKLLPPSEESLLRAVDDLVGIKKLVDGSLLNQSGHHGRSNVTSIVPHYDHVSDNAVEAMTMKETVVNPQAPPILDLSVDFFKFNKN